LSQRKQRGRNGSKVKFPEVQSSWKRDRRGRPEVERSSTFHRLKARFGYAFAKKIEGNTSHARYLASLKKELRKNDDAVG
jgi:hypothetical protein